MQKAFIVTKIIPFKETQDATKYEFTARSTNDYILIKGKRDATFGGHWHEGLVDSKNPEVILLVQGMIKLSCRHIKTKEVQETEVQAPARVEIFPFWHHTVVSLSDVIFMEFISINEHQSDCFK